MFDFLWADADAAPGVPAAAPVAPVADQPAAVADAARRPVNAGCRGASRAKTRQLRADVEGLLRRENPTLATAVSDEFSAAANFTSYSAVQWDSMGVTASGRTARVRAVKTKGHKVRCARGLSSHLKATAGALSRKLRNVQSLTHVAVLDEASMWIQRPVDAKDFVELERRRDRAGLLRAARASAAAASAPATQTRKKSRPGSGGGVSKKSVHMPNP